MSFDEDHKVLLAERERLAKAHADIVEYWEPKVRELKSKYASANSKIATLNSRIARLEATFGVNQHRKTQGWASDDL